MIHHCEWSSRSKRRAHKNPKIKISRPNLLTHHSTVQSRATVLQTTRLARAHITLNIFRCSSHQLPPQPLFLTSNREQQHQTATHHPPQGTISPTNTASKCPHNMMNNLWVLQFRALSLQPRFSWLRRLQLPPLGFGREGWVFVCWQAGGGAGGGMDADRNYLHLI